MKYLPISDVIIDKISGEWGKEANDDSKTSIAVIRTANFLNTGRINFKKIVRREIESRKVSKKKLINGDVIIEKSGGSPTQPVGRVVLFSNPDNDTYLCNNFTTILRANKDIIDSSYLFYVLFDNHLKGKTQRYQNKTTGIINLKLDKYLDSEIPVPEDINDQKRIAHVLGKVEGLIAQQKQHLQQLDDLLKSVFLDMFGDPKSNPNNFPLKKLSAFYINPKEGTKCGPFGSALKKDELVNSGIPVWNMDNIDTTGRMVSPFRMWITSEKYENLSTYSVIDGDIIISRAGTVGKMCVAKMAGKPAIISTNLIRLRLNEQLRPLHIVSMMTYCKGRIGRLKVGPDGAFTHMNTGVLDKLQFPYPPIDLQDKFGAIYEKVDSIKLEYQESLNDLETLYAALSQKVFKGELDLSLIPLLPDPPRNLVLKVIDVDESPQVDDYPMDSSEGRQQLLKGWFQEFIEDNADKSLEQFWQSIRYKGLDYTSGESYDGNEQDSSFTVDDYDQLKEWVFAQIRSGQFEQAYIEDKKCIQLQAVKA